jgi:hypothetical protein
MLNFLIFLIRFLLLRLALFIEVQSGVFSVNYFAIIPNLSV